MNYINGSKNMNLYQKAKKLLNNEYEHNFEIVKEKKTVFITQIGHKLKNGLPHDNRAPDYDDWTLNGDILIYNRVLDIAFEISSKPFFIVFKFFVT